MVDIIEAGQSIAEDFERRLEACINPIRKVYDWAAYNNRHERLPIAGVFRERFLEILEKEDFIRSCMTWRAEWHKRYELHDAAARLAHSRFDYSCCPHDE